MSRTKRLVIPATLLRKMYVEDGHSVSHIAKHLSCSDDTVLNRMRNYGIDRRPKRKDIGREELEDLYVGQGLSLKSCSKILGCSVTTVRSRLKEWGILRPGATVPHISEEEGREIVRLYGAGNSLEFIAKSKGLSTWKVMMILRTYQVPSRPGGRRKFLNIEEIIYLYTVRRMSTVSIGRLYGVKSCTISARLLEVGIKPRGNKKPVDPLLLRAHFERGDSVRKLCEDFQVSYHTLHKHLKKMGLGCKKPQKLCFEEIASLREKGWTFRAIGEKYATSPNTVRNYMVRYTGPRAAP